MINGGPKKRLSDSGREGAASMEVVPPPPGERAEDPEGEIESLPAETSRTPAEEDLEVFGQSKTD